MSQVGNRAHTLCGSLASLLLLLPASAAAQPIRDEIPVFVALELLPTPGLERETDLSAELGRIVAQLEGHGSGPIRVLERFLLESRVLGEIRGPHPHQGLRMAALQRGARYLVLVSLTRLAGRESYDVRVLSVGSGPTFARFTGSDAVEVGRAARQHVLALGERHGSVWAQGLNGGSREEPPQIPPPRAPLPTSFEVVEVRVEGQRRIDADAIRSVLRTRVGDQLTRERVAEDIRRIYELGFFRDVKVLASDLHGGQLVTFRVEENPVIRQVSVTGNDNLGSEDITEQLTLTIGSAVEYPLLLENEARIEALYHAKGHYLAEVSYSIEPIGPDAVSVDFDVVEGPELRLTAIRFEGNESIGDSELRKGLQTKPWNFFSNVSHYWDASGLYTEPVFYQDLDSITKKYMDQGFIRVKVSDPEVEYDEEGLEVLVIIEEGPQYRVGTVDVLGDDSLDAEQLLAMIRLRPEEVFSRSKLSDDVERLRSRYADRGFYAARVRPRTDVDPDQLTVDVLFEVERGEPFFIDWIKVAGNTRTRDQVVRREISLAEGELFSDGALERSRARVRRLGFFEEVSVQTQQLEANTLGITVDVVERPTGSFSFGAGVGSTDGVLLNTSIRQDNLFGKGWALNLSLDMGNDTQFASLRFSNPSLLGTAMGFATSLSYSDREFDDFKQEIVGTRFDVSYPLDEGDTTGTAGYGFSSREVSGFSEFRAASLLQREEYQDDTTTSLLSLAARSDTRDDIRFPREGHVNGLAMEFAGLGGLSKFVRLEGRTTYFLPAEHWTGFQSTFIVNSRVGYVLPLNDLDDFDLPGCETSACQANLNSQVQPLTNIDSDLELPLTERYFLGGVGPFQVRGFKQRTLGPRRAILNPAGTVPGTDDVLFTTSDRNDDGTCPLGDDSQCNSIRGLDDPDDYADVDLTDVIGGNKMFLLNLELQFPLSEELGLMGIVFFDMGNAFAEEQSFSPAELRLGTGFGAQWFSPFGPILVQMGFPLNPFDNEDGSVFEFSLGGQQF